MNICIKTMGCHFLSSLGAFMILSQSVFGQTCTVNWTNVHQQIDGFGACSAFASTMTSAQAATLFGTNNGQMGLSLWRVRIDETGAWGTETTNAAYAHQYGAKVLGSPWLAPSAWMSSGSLLPSHYVDWANWLSNAAVSINLDYVSIQNEPDFGAQGGWMSWTSTQIFNFMKTNAPAIGRPIVMPESFQFNDAYSDPVINDPVAVNNFVILGGHIYGGGNYVHTNALAHGKPVWMTEHFNQAGNTNTYWATTNILCAVNFAWEIGQCMNNQMSAYIWWRTIHSPYAYDDLIVGATPDVTGYAVGQFARFIRPGYVRLDVSTSNTNLSVTAFKVTNSGSFAIVAVNTNLGPSIVQTFNLTNFPAVSSVTPWITSASMSLSNQTPVAVNGFSFTYTLPAQSVVTFVGQGSVTPSSITISNVSYNPSGPAFVLTWNSTPGATYSVFRTNVLGVSAAQWPVMITGYPSGGANGGSLSYTDTTATLSPAFYRVSSP
jgi:glucuronoarabinoxylan endo-1,4-beta-xylanase